MAVATYTTHRGVRRANRLTARTAEAAIGSRLDQVDDKALTCLLDVVAR
jgi:hypothetical protein